MKKTIKQRFFLSLCLLMLFSFFGGCNLAWAEGTTVTYTVSSKSAVTTSGTAPSGSSATFKNTYSGSIKEQLTKGDKMTLTLSGYAGQKITGLSLSMKSNKSGGAGYLDVKAGTKQLAAIGSSKSGVSFSNAAWNGKWSTSYVDVKVSLLDNTYIIQDGEKVVIVIGATANSLYCESFELTYEAGGSTPSITTSSSELTFGNVETSSSKQLSFTLSGQNLTADASLSITGTNVGYFSVAPTSVSQTDGTIVETPVTVTYAPTAAGTHTATLTIASGTTIKEISLSGTGIAPLPNYNVSWMVNGAPYTTGNPSTSVKEGESVTVLPTEPAAIGTKDFVGWTNKQIAAAQSTAPTVLFSTPEDAPAVTGNVTYYAVFAVATGSEVWEEITTVPEPGTYAILSESYFMKAEITSSKRFAYGDATPEISTTSPATLTTAPASDCIWEITKPDEYYRIANGSQYAGGTSAKNEGALLDDASRDLAKWTIEHDGSEFSVSNYGRSIASKDKKNKYLRNNDSYGWACYGSGTGKAPRLFKKTNAMVLTDYCTTIPDVELAVGATGYATLYYSNFDLVVPENTEAYTFGSVDGALVESKRYEEGTVIPAGEAVVVYTINTVPCTLNFKKGIATAACDASSQLAGTDEKTAITPDADYYFYGLSLNSSNDLNSVGFYWMTADGAAFTNGAHKAYLKIPKNEFTGMLAIKGFAFNGTTTGVESVESNNHAPQVIYDLAGRRVSKAEKGIYIINGKKVIK